ncbi:MAG: DUF2344 domain-containing protein [Lachnospiraceae bacterium]|nr:DUF2344 domain-containing protein [Lachnospiraceae bacterium]
MKVRIKFSKTGSMKFIGHLDVMRYFQKAIRRSGIDVAYSQGFNPHQLISFASPLGVGLTSDGEYMDMQLNSSFSSKEAMDRLNEVMNEEIQIVNYVELDDGSKNAMSIVAAADYCISIKDGYDFPENYREMFEKFIEQPEIIVLKKTKKSEKTMDIRPYIYHVAYMPEEFVKKTGGILKNTVAEQYENNRRIFMQITNGSVINIKPEVIIEAFCKFAGIEFQPFAYQIHRMEVYADINADNKVDEKDYGKNRKLIPLDAFGHEIL